MKQSALWISVKSIWWNCRWHLFREETRCSVLHKFEMFVGQSSADMAWAVCIWGWSSGEMPQWGILFRSHWHTVFKVVLLCELPNGVCETKQMQKPGGQVKNVGRREWLMESNAAEPEMTKRKTFFFGKYIFWLLKDVVLKKILTYNFFRTALRFFFFLCVCVCMFLFYFFFFLFFMVLHVFPILMPPPTSLSARSLWVLPVHQVQALVSCIQPGLVICFTLDNVHVSMLFSWNIPPSPSHTESKSLFYTSVSLFLFYI